jgi:hypothetical protein
VESPSSVVFRVEEEPQPEKPTITGIEPRSGRQGEKLELTILGTGLEDTREVTFGDEAIEVGEIVGTSKEKITIVAGISSTAEPGVRPIVITMGTGVVIESPKEIGFEVLEREVPTISGITPNSGSVGSSPTVVISGNYLDGAGKIAFPSGGVSATLLSTTDSEIRARLDISSDAPIGNHYFEIATPSGVIDSHSANIYFRVFSGSSGISSKGWNMGIGGDLL